MTILSNMMKIKPISRAKSSLQRRSFRICVGDDTFFLYNENKTLPPAQEISKLIKENGGQVFLAHPYVYDLKDHIGFINALYNDKIIDGLECYHSNFTKEQTKTLINYCHKKIY